MTARAGREGRTVPHRCLHFVTPRVAKLLASDAPEPPAKTEKSVAVLFVDIVGCTRLCEELSPRDMNALTERYFSRFFDVIQDAGGSVSEIMGDGLMAIFERPPFRSAILAAAGAAARIRELVRSMRAADDVGAHETDVHMGLHAGTAFVGFTRFRARKWERWTYTASGPVTNIAARLCNLAGAGSILLCEDVGAVVREEYHLQPMGTRKLKNVRHSLRVYELRERRVERPRRAEDRAEGALDFPPHEAADTPRARATATRERER